MSKLTSHFRRFIRRKDLLFTIYLTLVSGGGALLIVHSLAYLPTYTPAFTFLLLVAFTAFAAFVTTSVPLQVNTGITYHIGSAISIAAEPLFGAGGSVLIATIHGLLSWVVKPSNERSWKKTGRQLAFNLGMDAITIFVVSHLLHWLRLRLGNTTLWADTLPWLLAAIAYNEVNLWLVMGVVRLQNGPTVNLWEMWRADRWATQIDILLMAVGGGLLAFAIQHYDWVGVIIFFLPIALSAYAFRLYTRQMQAHLNNLDNIIHERTASLQTTLAQLQVEIQERERVEAELRRLATIDPLTNALNRRAFFDYAQEAFGTAKATTAPFAALMFDLDRFKQINDRYGHAAGDAALKYFAALPPMLLQKPHLFGRLGGEEFALCLLDANAETAIAIGEQLCYLCPATPIMAGDVAFTVSVSVGVAWLKATDQTLDQLLERADRRLYLAKRQGGNQVVKAAEPATFT